MKEQTMIISIPNISRIISFLINATEKFGSFFALIDLSINIFLIFISFSFNRY